MAPNDTEPPSRTPVVPAPGSRPSHHLASVAHHFFSDSPVSSEAPAPVRPVVVVQTGPAETAALVHGRVQSSRRADRSRAPILAVPGDLPAVESLRGNATGFVPQGAVVVWGTDRIAARSLLPVRDLGRWVRVLEPAFLEVVVLDPDAAATAADREALRSRVDRIARGLPVRVSFGTADELEAVLAEPGAPRGAGCSP